jgi:hypothetical protein
VLSRSFGRGLERPGQASNAPGQLPEAPKGSVVVWLTVVAFPLWVKSRHPAQRTECPLSAVSGHIASHRVASTLPLTTLRVLSHRLDFLVNVLRHLVDGETRRLLGWRICDEGSQREIRYPTWKTRVLADGGAGVGIDQIFTL